MIYKKFKCSAIHNMLITKEDDNLELYEGIAIPTDILQKTNIFDGQEVIITKIGAGNWKNRIKTFVIENKINNDVEIRGSLTHFLKKGDLTCLIAECYMDEKTFDEYKNNEYAIFDLGFDPKNNYDNTKSTLDFQYYNYKEKDVSISSELFTKQVKKREKLLKCFAESIVIGLKVNNTHPDCLQGSAELPGSIMKKAGLYEYKSVSVYNASLGGVADTYSVPMPEGVVMTTGAMASFASIGDTVNVVGYVLSEKPVEKKIVLTKENKAC